MEIVSLPIDGLKLIKPKIITDNRGYFLESFKKELFEQEGIDTIVFQENHSYSTFKTLRGMHFQRSPGQNKLISVVGGKIFDVVVDIRPDSKTFGQWFGVYLDDISCCQLFIPNGFAHGFCVMSKDVHVLYKVSHPYIENEEKGFIWNDKTIGICWPFEDPILSKRDEKAETFKEVFSLDVVL